MAPPPQPVPPWRVVKAAVEGLGLGNALPGPSVAGWKLALDCGHTFFRCRRRPSVGAPRRVRCHACAWRVKFRPAIDAVIDVADDCLGDHVGLLEALHTRGLWPWSPGDPAAPWWTFGRADPSSIFKRSLRFDAARERPFGVDQVVNVASLGVPMLVKVAALVRETSTRLEPHGLAPIERIVWRVGVPQPLMGAAWLRDASSSNPPPYRVQSMLRNGQIGRRLYASTVYDEIDLELWRLYLAGVVIDSLHDGVATVACRPHDWSPPKGFYDDVVAFDANDNRQTGQTSLSV